MRPLALNSDGDNLGRRFFAMQQSLVGNRLLSGVVAFAVVTLCGRLSIAAHESQAVGASAIGERVR